MECTEEDRGAVLEARLQTTLPTEEIDNLHVEFEECEDHKNQEDGASKRRKMTKTYKLLSLCDVRWYSSWMVMTRFYSLFEVLTCVKEECQKSKYLKTNGRREFINAWHRLVRIRCSAPSTTSARWCKALTSFNGIIPSVCTSSQ